MRRDERGCGVGGGFLKNHSQPENVPSVTNTHTKKKGESKRFLRKKKNTTVHFHVKACGFHSFSGVPSG